MTTASHVLLVVAACGPARAPGSPPAREQADPVVDMACVRHVLDGTLAATLPAQVGPYALTASPHGAHLHKDGRKLDDAEGQKLWQAFNSGVFTSGMSTASHALSSVYTCSDADRPSCIKLDMWVCQLSVDALAQRLAGALDRAGLADAELSVDVTFVETPPNCRDGAACQPQPHYSTRDGHYDPARVRTTSEGGHGSCTNDGDCEPGGQSCTTWYLAGGASTLEYRQYGLPTFCGCVRHRCRWFQQP
jgi:hypothetical protein